MLSSETAANLTEARVKYGLHFRQTSCLYQLVLCSEGPVQSFDLTGAQNCLLSERATEKPQGEAVPAWPSLDPKGAHTFCLQLLETVLERSVKSKTNC